MSVAVSEGNGAPAMILEARNSLQAVDHTILVALAAALAGRPESLRGFDAETVARTAIEHGAGALLSERLHAADSSQPRVDFDGEAAALLRNHARSQAASDMLLNRATRETVALLAGNGIPTLLLKGTPIALLHYSASYLRNRCDSDLYIRCEDVERTAAILTGHGYSLAGSDRRAHVSRQLVATHRTFGDVPLHFDIHWKLSNRTHFADVLVFEPCWVERQPVPALGPDAWALADTGLLLHACIHRIAHGRGTERNRLIWLYDIHLLWNAMGEADKSAFVEKALNKKIGAVCADALEVCGNLFSTAVAATPHDWCALLRQNRRHEPTAALINAGKFRWAWADLMGQRGFRQKLLFGKELLLGR